MLIITRDINEETLIVCPDGELITVKYLTRKGNQISIGVNAPRSYKIIRKSHYETLKQVEDKILKRAVGEN